MNSPQKRTWLSPQLVVLVRGRPEENVLSACKLASGATGPGNANNVCRQTAHPRFCTGTCTSRFGT
jgi:hypothetical protein